MRLARVIGIVLAQQKEEFLIGKKIFLCEEKANGKGNVFVAVDLVGAGVGNEVLAAFYHGAGKADDLVKAASDAYIVAIVDEVKYQEKGK